MKPTLAVLAILVGSVAFAQGPKDVPNVAVQGDELAKAAKLHGERMVEVSYYLSVGVLASLVFLTIAVWVLAASGCLPKNKVFQMWGMILITHLGIFIVAAGFGQAQIAGIMGLLGTALGYLFAQKSEKEKPSS